MNDADAYEMGYDDGYKGLYENPFDRLNEPELWEAYHDGHQVGMIDWETSCDAYSLDFLKEVND